MSIIIDKLPLLRRNQDIPTPVGTWPFQRNQIVIYIGIYNPNKDDNEENGFPCFPAILDTGCGLNLHIYENHLIEWTCKNIGSYDMQSERVVNNIGVRMFTSDINIFYNVPGRVEPDLSKPPIRVATGDGIAIQPKGDGQPRPRVPLLGMALLEKANLLVEIDFCNRFVNIKRNC